MPAPDLAQQLAILRAHGVREAAFRPDGSLERVLFATVDTPPAATKERSDEDLTHTPPRGPLAHSRMRPARETQ